MLPAGEFQKKQRQRYFKKGDFEEGDMDILLTLRAASARATVNDSCLRAHVQTTVFW